MTVRSSSAQTPRVLFVTHNFPRTSGDAAGSFVLRLARALVDAGAVVHVLAPGAPGLPARDIVDGIPVERVRYARDDRQTLAYEGAMAETVRASWSGRLALLGLLWHMRQATRRAITQARRNGTPYDVVHAHWWFPAGLIAWQAGVGKAGMPPLVITLHGSDVRLASSVTPAHGLMRRVLGRARHVTAVSRWLAEQATRIAPKVTVTVAPMPVDTERFAPGTTPRSGRLLFVGRMNAQKGAADLLDALARTAHPVSCDMIGDGPDREALLERARTLGVEDRLTWHGSQPSEALPAFYASALATVMPSREEGLGLVAVESQLCETPVIAYASGGLPDVVDPTQGGTLVAAGDTAALARAFDAMTGDPASAAAMGVDARRHLADTFSPSGVAARYLAYYEAVQHTAGAPIDESIPAAPRDT